MSDSQMNFVFFFPDEMRAESLGCYGHPIVKTPNLDKLAEEGIRFDQCHVQSTVCAPSRSSLMTGLYPHVSGHRTLWHLLRPHEPSLFKYLKEAGYKIKWFGKNHAYSDEYFAEIMGQDAYGKLEEMSGDIRGDFKYKNPYDKDDERFYSFLMEPDKNEVGRTETEVNIQSAIDFLESDEAKDGPFILFLPTVIPHAPYVAPEPYHSMYDHNQLPNLRPVCEENKPSHHKLIREYRRLDKIKDDTMKKIQSVYLGMITHVDAVFGQLLDSINENGLSNNTTIIVSSDHGDYAGDYGLVEKWPNGMEDCLTRVPLIIRTPEGQKGHVVQEQVELFDIMPTILELADVAITHDHFAQSLVPQLNGAKGDPNRVVFTEGGYDQREPHCFEGDPVRDAAFAHNPENIYWPKARQQQEHPQSVCRTTMMRTLEFKLIRRVEGVSELYDLKLDPYELKNVYHQQEYREIRIEMEEKLLNWYIQTSDVVPRNNDGGKRYLVKENTTAQISIK